MEEIKWGKQVVIVNINEVYRSRRDVQHLQDAAKIGKTATTQAHKDDRPHIQTEEEIRDGPQNLQKIKEKEP